MNCFLKKKYHNKKNQWPKPSQGTQKRRPKGNSKTPSPCRKKIEDPQNEMKIIENSQTLKKTKQKTRHINKIKP
jgi:hypothetical protein